MRPYIPRVRRSAPPALLAASLLLAGCGLGGTTTVVRQPTAPGTTEAATPTRADDPDDPGFSAARVASLLESRLETKGAFVTSTRCTPSVAGQFGCGVVARTKVGTTATFTYTARPADGSYDFESTDGKGLEPDPR